ncbi:MlaD family protein [Desulfocicer niacini]
MHYRVKHLSIMLFTLLLLMGCNNFLLNLSFSDIQGLKKEAPLFFDQNKVGRVTHIAYTDTGDFLVSVEIDTAFQSAFTEHSRFEIIPSPLKEDEKAILMTLTKKGGEKLEKGATVKATPPSPFQGLTPFFDKFKSGFDDLMNNMKSIPESDQYQKLENQIDELTQKMKTSGQALQESIRNDLIPRLKQQIEELSRQLKEKGMEDKAAPLEKKLQALEDV